MSTESTIRITTDDQHCYLTSPYSPQVPPAARGLGGRWDPQQQVWVFAARDVEHVRELARSIYGTDGTETDLVDIRLDLDAMYAADAPEMEAARVVVAGRVVAHRPGRDARVRLGDGVVQLAGRWPASGGSVNRPSLGNFEGVILEVRGVPRHVAEERGYTIIDAEAENAAMRAAALHDERARLTERLSQIDAELAELAD